MNTWDLIRLNLLSPMVLCFGLGLASRLAKSDLRLPPGLYSALSLYLLLSIGLKGGTALSQFPVSEVAVPLLVAIVLGGLIPFPVFAAAKKLGKFGQEDAGALAAHYGSVSAVTFLACIQYLQQTSFPAPGYAPALVAAMEIPGIITALILAGADKQNGGLGPALKEVVTGKSIILLGGGLLVGVLAGPTGWQKVEPFFGAPFAGALCLFMLEMGMLAANALKDLPSKGLFVGVFGIVSPIILGLTGVFVGRLCGLDAGSMTVLGVLSGSASYIAAPAAVKMALPNADLGLSLTAAVGVTFPFNLAVGIPLLAWVSLTISG